VSPAIDPPRLTALRVLFVALCLAVVTAPALNMVVPFFAQAPLVGAVAKLSRPAATLSSLFDESYQRALTAYFEREYGARPLATRLDNSLDYWVFGEASPGSRVRVGGRDTLYLDEQLNYLNRRDAPDPGAVAAKIARAQRLLQAQGKALIVMLEPTKTTVWPDDVPAGWRIEGATAEGARARIADPYVAALRNADVAFVDGRSAVARLPRDAVYTRTGRHVSPPASCEILAAALELARPLVRGAELPPADCRYQMRAGGVLDEDFDLFLLLNVWAPHPTNAVPIMEPAPDLVPRERRPDAMVIGSSFGWNIVYQAERIHAFRHLYFHYYSITLEDRDGGPARPLPLRSQEWKDVVASTTLFLYPIPEEFLIQDAEPFVDAVIATYGASP
jgi:hypothetical protein